jgi:hypothetical protein
MADREDVEQAAGETARQEEATSKETLDDLRNEENDSITSATGGATNEGGTTSETASPSPDGAFDSERGDGTDAGEPM